MATLGFLEAFAEFGAKPHNARWAMSAITGDGALVIGCWQHYIKPGADGVLLYGDQLSRWKGNALGNKLFSEHLSRALAERLPVRMVVVTTAETDAVDHGHDASKLKKTFRIKKDFTGTVTSFDGDNFFIEFRRTPQK